MKVIIDQNLLIHLYNTLRIYETLEPGLAAVNLNDDGTYHISGNFRPIIRRTSDVEINSHCAYITTQNKGFIRESSEEGGNWSVELTNVLLLLELKDPPPFDVWKDEYDMFSISMDARACVHTLSLYPSGEIIPPSDIEFFVSPALMIIRKTLANRRICRNLTSTPVTFPEHCRLIDLPNDRDTHVSLISQFGTETTRLTTELKEAIHEFSEVTAQER